MFRNDESYLQISVETYRVKHGTRSLIDIRARHRNIEAQVSMYNAGAVGAGEIVKGHSQHLAIADVERLKMLEREY